MNYYFSAGLEVARGMQMNKRNPDTAQSSRTPRQEFPSDTNSINGKWKLPQTQTILSLQPCNLMMQKVQNFDISNLDYFFSIAFIVWNM